MRKPLSISSTRNATSGTALGCLFLLAINACDRPARPPLVRAVDREQAAAPAEPQAAVLWETWDAYFVRGEHVGFSHVRAEAIEPSDPPLVRFVLEDRLTLRRGAGRMTQLLTQTSTERRDGTLESFEAQLQVGPSVTTYRGQRQGDQLQIVTRNGGQQASRTIPWQDDFHGLLGVQQSLRRSPMQPGQSRQIQALLPLQYETGTFELEAVGMAAVPLLDGQTAELLEIKSRLHVGPEMTIDTVLWVDAEGQVLKSLMPALELITYRTDAATATRPAAPTKDLLSAAAVPLDEPLDQPQRVQQARYRLTAVDSAGAPADDFPANIPDAPGQRVHPGGHPGQREVTVRAGADASDALPPPTDADRQSGAIIDSGDARIAQLAQRFVGRSSPDRLAEALRLADHVYRYVDKKDFSRAFATASQVALEARGDCTEHSVLLAALLRARGIPARVAAGLVYMDTADGPVMAYHMWTLAYLDRHGWLPLDATLNQSPAAANRITLVTSDLTSGNEYDSLLPILGVIGRLQIEIVDVQTSPPADAPSP